MNIKEKAAALDRLTKLFNEGKLIEVGDPEKPCDGCKHKPGRYYGRCIHCSRNPKATEDYYETETDP